MTDTRNASSRTLQQHDVGGRQGQTVEAKATQVTERVADRAQSTFENLRGKACEQLDAVANALEKSTDHLAQNQQQALSDRLRPLVQKTNAASQYLRDKSPRELKEAVERLARSRPAWLLGGVFAAGLVAARFLKSSERRANDPGGTKGRVGYATS